MWLIFKQSICSSCFHTETDQVCEVYWNFSSFEEGKKTEFICLTSTEDSLATFCLWESCTYKEDKGLSIDSMHFIWVYRF